MPRLEPKPWLEVTTATPPDYNFVQDVFAFSTPYAAMLGSGVAGATYGIVDEELLQSVRIPTRVKRIQWQQQLRLNSSSTSPDPDDNFIFAFKEATTGVLLYQVTLDTATMAMDEWMTHSLSIDATSIAGKNVSLSYSNLTDQDDHQTGLFIDNVTLECSD